jgi:hypothetical protein
MAIKTRWERPRDRILADTYHPCAFGKNEHQATYWTQDEQPDGQQQAPVVWHCQGHRSEAREEAEAK